MARNKKRKKNKSRQIIKLKPQNYIIKKARRLPIYKCIINDDWKDSGISVILVARKRMNGNLVVGQYIIDTFCLGLKETSYSYDISTFQLDEMIDDIEHGMMLTPIGIDAITAFNLIYGAIEYAEDIGFSPHKDFRVTEYILDDVETIEFVDIEFGKDGKPLFVSGPYDNIDKIINTLERNVGSGNYHSLVHQDLDNGYYDLNPAFPEDIVDENLNLLDENSETAYNFQLMIAGIIYDKLQGDFINLDFDDEFYDEVANEFFYRNIKQDIPDEDENAIAIEVFSFIEKIEKQKSIDFLFKRGYDPLPKNLSLEELEALNSEEREEFEKQVLDAMSDDDHTDFLFSRSFILFISERAMFENKEIDAIISSDRDKLTKEFIDYVNEKFLEEEEKLTEENYDYISEIIEQTIESYRDVDS